METSVVCEAVHFATDMKHSEYSIPVKIAYLGGGSLNWALNLMSDLAQDTRLAAEVRLYDLDMSAVRRNEQIGRRYGAVSAGVPAKYRAVRRIEDALDQADIVIISILPGSFEDMANDINIPERFDIRQAVGDTVGPGGFVRAMRAVPQLLEIGEAIRTYAPEAFVCNLTNPMSILTGALYRAFPEIKCWGECHEVTKLRKIVAWIANGDAGERICDFRDVHVNVLGINHCTFVDQISLADKNMKPAYQDFAETHARSGWTENESTPANEYARYFDDRNRVKFDLFERFGVAAAAGDRHLAEFFPASDYLDEHEKWAFGLTPVSFRVRHQESRRRYAEQLATGSLRPEARRSDEALIDQIVALMGGGRHVSNANLPNRGQIHGFAQGSIVETNVSFDCGEIRPVYAGWLPPDLETTLADHSNRQMKLLTVLTEGNYRDLFPLFHSDPLVRELPEKAASRMFKEMVAATAHLLPSALVKEAA
jgi:galacturan 1,4-alpha-galacturonidase